MNTLITALGDRVTAKKITWKKASQLYNEELGTDISPENLRQKYIKLTKDIVPEKKQALLKDDFTLYGDGHIEADIIVNLTPEEKRSASTVLAKMGFDIHEWVLNRLDISAWQQHTKEQTTKNLYACKASLFPVNKTDLTLEECAEIGKEVFSKAIKPLKPKYTIQKDLDDNKLLEDPGIELHLGKMAWAGDTGQNYDKDIAMERFKNILTDLLRVQNIEKCGTLFVGIGNDLFNSDTVNATTTKGTPQTNDLRWRKMAIIGLSLYKLYIDSVLDKFNRIEIRYVPGNHDKMASFYLYLMLREAYSDCPNIHFSDNYKEVQCFPFGDCAIFYGHGDVKGKGGLKRLIGSIPSEFYKEWGASIFRELHLAHLHKEFVVDDENGLVIRRSGSPTGTDQWHYEERYLGATQKQQLYIWDKFNGLQEVKYLNFRPDEEYKKTLKKGN